jgi:hypothetical protein
LPAPLQFSARQFGSAEASKLERDNASRVQQPSEVIRRGSDLQPLSVAASHELLEAVREYLPPEPLFTKSWYRRHRGAWHVAAIDDHAWELPSWFALKYWLRINSNAFPHHYGITIEYRAGDVIVGDARVASAQQHKEKAFEIAAHGQVPEEDKALWMPLGVFALVEQTTPLKVTAAIQLSVDMNGMIRGTSWSMKDKRAVTIRGHVDTKSQRAVWQIGDGKRTFEAGIYNLTSGTAPLLVHTTRPEPAQMRLLRLTRTP